MNYRNNLIIDLYPSDDVPCDPPFFYSVKDTCRALSLGKTTIYGLLRDNKLTRIRHGARTLVLRESVENYAFALMLRQGGGHGSSSTL
ncbi:helix-turn-helix domain-containing protein [Novosphingobium sp. PASSN1]|uniref:helix-turn-helix domain-containing protein n=1 Tax=Novosphingobium sp. PASSN1 TaxID=2015561 RepID=UPI0025D96F98|nr:helix-turn-helix domain-containing protein [Novosphingobium sp. PASSN1]